MGLRISEVVGVKMRMEVLLVRLAGGSASFYRVGQGGFDAKCDRAGVLQALWAVPSKLQEHININRG